MLNLNSPLVQQMLSNTPNGSIGNIPGCYGNPPTVESYTVPRNSDVPFPTPMEMARKPYDGPMPEPLNSYNTAPPTHDYGDRLMMMFNQHPSCDEQPPDMSKLHFCGYSEPNIYQNQQQSEQPPDVSKMRFCGYSEPYRGQPQQQYGYYPQQNMQPSYPYPVQESPMFGFNHPVFQGYSNPYMGSGSPYNGGFYDPSVVRQVPMDEDSRRIYEQARYNGISYQEQINLERDFYKSLSRACSVGLGRSEEETNERLKLYDDQPKQNVQPEPTMWYNENRVVPPSIRVRVLKGDEVILDTKDRKPRCNNYANFSYRMHTWNIIEQQNRMMQDRRTIKNNWNYDHCPEREMDNCSLIEFFNDHAWKLTDALNKREITRQKYLNRDLFDRNLFNQRLELDRARFNSVKSMDIVERRLNRIAESVETAPISTSSDGNLIRGKNGVLPDGRQVSPNVDPSIAESFTVDRSTGKMYIDMPIYMKERLGIPLSEQDKKFKIAEDEFVKIAMGSQTQ